MCAEELNGCATGKIYRCSAILILRIHLRTIGDKQFGDFPATILSRKMQSSPSILSPCIHLGSIIQVLFNSFNVS